MHAHEIDVQPSQSDESRRQQHRMHGIETRQRRTRNAIAAKHQMAQRMPDERDVFRNVRADDRRPVRLQIPRQQIAGEAEAERDEEEHDAGDPGAFARLTIGAGEEARQHVQEHDDHHGGSAPVMNAAQQPAGRHLGHDVIDRLISLVRRRVVIHRQEHAGNEHRAEEHDEQAAEGCVPTGAGGELFEEERADAGFPADALARRVIEAVEGFHARPRVISVAWASRPSVRAERLTGVRSECSLPQGGASVLLIAAPSDDRRPLCVHICPTHAAADLLRRCRFDRTSHHGRRSGIDPIGLPNAPCSRGAGSRICSR